MKVKAHTLQHVVLSEISKIDFEVKCDGDYISNGRCFIHRKAVKDIKTQNTTVLLWLDGKLETGYEHLGKCVEKNVGLATVPIARTGVFLQYNGDNQIEICVDRDGGETYLNTAYTPLLDLGESVLQIPEEKHLGMVVIKRGDLVIAGFMPVKLQPEDMYENRMEAARASLAAKEEPQNAEAKA